MASNFHAVAAIVEQSGVLIIGPSGAGKTELAFALIAAARLAGRFARLVGDDQLFLRAAAGRLVAAVPPSIAGLAEVRGFGPVGVEHEPQMVVDLLVRIVPAQQAPRFAEPAKLEIAGVAVPMLELATENAERAAAAILAFLRVAPFR